MVADIDLYELLENVHPANKNQLTADCPYCQKGDGHFFIKKKTDEIDKRGNNKSYQFRCLKCNEEGGLYTLLKHLDRLDLVKVFRDTSIFSEKLLKINLSNLTKTIVRFDENSLYLQEQALPTGFKRLHSDEYLENRGITPEDFEKYKFGSSKILSRYKDRIILLIEERGKCVGYIARSKKTKEEVQALKIRGIKHARYLNSVSDFGKMLFGYEEIQRGKTNTVIAVEGVFDKFNVTKLLNLYHDSELKCVACFGKKISDEQIHKLQIAGVKNIVLMFDPDAYKDTFKYAFELSKYFNVLVAKLTECDPGDITLDQLMDVLDNLQSPLEFGLNTINNIILK